VEHVPRNQSTVDIFNLPNLAQLGPKFATQICNSTTSTRGWQGLAVFVFGPQLLGCCNKKTSFGIFWTNFEVRPHWGDPRNGRFGSAPLSCQAVLEERPLGNNTDETPPVSRNGFMG